MGRKPSFQVALATLLGSFAFILAGIPVNNTKYIEDYNYELWRKLSKLFPSQRFSPYEDEYQVKDKISLDTVIGIKIPDKEKDKDNKYNRNNFNNSCNIITISIF